MNSRYYLTFKSTFQAEKPKKLEKTSLTDAARLEQMLNFWNVIMCTNFVYSTKKLTLVHSDSIHLVKKLLMILVFYFLLILYLLGKSILGCCVISILSMYNYHMFKYLIKIWIHCVLTTVFLLEQTYLNNSKWRRSWCNSKSGRWALDWRIATI